MNKHPINISNEFVEVFWLNQWNKCKYYSWEPETENDFTQPKKGGKYIIRYNVAPLHIETGIECQQWKWVHESRVRVIK